MYSNKKGSSKLTYREILRLSKKRLTKNKQGSKLKSGNHTNVKQSNPSEEKASISEENIVQNLDKSIKPSKQDTYQIENKKGSTSSISALDRVYSSYVFNSKY